MPTRSRQDRPLAWWRFEDAPADPAPAALAGPAARHGDGTAVSETGNHAARYRGAVTATAGAAGIGGLAAQFQTPGAHVWVPPHPALDGNVVSVEFWFSSTQAFPDRYWPGSGTFVSKATDSAASSDWVIIAGCLRGEDPGRVVVGSGARPGGDLTLASPARLSDGTWHHIVWTRSAEGQNFLYVDGQVAAAGSDGGGSIGNGRPITIGGDPILGGRDLIGAMDEVAIYDRVLEAGRVEAHFARPTPRAIAFLPTSSLHWSKAAVPAATRETNPREG